jgi:hypothetical protein
MLSGMFRIRPLPDFWSFIISLIGSPVSEYDILA